MDRDALILSLQLAGWTVLVLLPLGIVLGRVLAWRRFRGKAVVEASLALPLVLPPTVLGYYLLVALGSASPLGQLYESITGGQLVFTFGGLLVASIVFNLPFAIQPMQRAFEGVSREVRDAAACCGLTRWRTLWRIELPLAWPGVISAIVLTFAHTLGEFGVVLMVGGNIPGETRTIAVAIYDRVQAFDEQGAAVMSATLLVVCLVAIGATFFTGSRIGRRQHE
ncbi:MAG: molybdate transport system permease protein [Betaproteobacteria bacterium]|nr:molybdate transport system permease protein [Betaproteobacteria bacterium]